MNTLVYKSQSKLLINFYFLVSIKKVKKFIDIAFVDIIFIGKVITLPSLCLLIFYYFYFFIIYNFL